MAEAAPQKAPDAVASVRDAFASAVQTYPKTDQPKIRKYFDESFAGVKSPADLPKAAKRFAARLDSVERKWARNLSSTILDPLELETELATSKAYLVPLREVAKSAFRVTPPKMDQEYDARLSRAERIATDISLGARRTGVGSVVAPLLAKVPVIGEPLRELYLPPGYQENPIVSGTTQAVLGLGELLVPGSKAAQGTRAVQAPALIDKAVRGAAGFGRAATLPARGALQIGTALGQAAARRLAPQAAGQTLGAAARARNLGLQGAGAGLTVAGFQQGTQYLDQARPIVGAIDPNTGAVTAERAPQPTIGETLVNLGLGTLGGGAGSAAVGAIGPTAGALTSRLREAAGAAVGALPGPLYDLIASGQVRPETIQAQIPGILVSALAGRPMTPDQFAVPPSMPKTAPKVADVDANVAALEEALQGAAQGAEPPAAPAVEAPEAPVETGLPRDRMPTSMRPGTPNYKNRVLDFGSDVELALYLATATNKPAATRAKYWEWLQKATGATKSELMREGAELRQRLREADSALPKGESIPVPTTVRDRLMPQAPPPEATTPKAPPAAPETTPPVTPPPATPETTPPAAAAGPKPPKKAKAAGYVSQLRKAIGGTYRKEAIPDETAFLNRVAEVIEKDIQDGVTKGAQTPEELVQLLESYGLTPDEQAKIAGSAAPAAPAPIAESGPVQEAAKLFLAGDSKGAVRVMRASGIPEAQFMEDLDRTIAQLRGGQAEGTFGPYEGPPVSYDPQAVAAKAQAALAGEVTPLRAEEPVTTDTVSAIQLPEPGELPPGARMVEGPETQQAEIIPAELPQTALDRLRSLASSLERRKLTGESAADYRRRAAMGQFMPKDKKVSLEIGGQKLPDAVEIRHQGTKNPAKDTALLTLEDGSGLKIFKGDKDAAGAMRWKHYSSAGTLAEGRISPDEYGALIEATVKTGIQESTQRDVAQQMKAQAAREEAQTRSEDPEVQAAVARMQARLGKYLTALTAGGIGLGAGPAEAAQLLATGSPDAGLIGFAAASGALAYSHGLPLMTMGLRALNDSPTLQAAATALRQASPTPIKATGAPSALLSEPGVQTALDTQAKAPPSWAETGARKAAELAGKIAKPLQNYQTERNRLLRVIGEHAIGKALSIVNPRAAYGIDKDTLRSATGTALANFFDRGLANTVEIGRRLVETVGRVPEYRRTTVATDSSGNPIIDPATGAPKMVPLRLPETLLKLRDRMAQQVADGETTAARIEDYLINQYGTRTRELLEQVIESGGALPAQFANDKIVTAFVTKMPDMLNDLYALGHVSEDQVAKADRFLIRTMTPGAPGFAGMLNQLVSSFKTTPDDPKRSMFWYGKGNVQNAMDPAVFADYTRPWEFVSETPDQMVIRDSLNGQTRTVSKRFDPVTGEVEADNYLHRNLKFPKNSPQAYESPWMELDGAPAGRVRAARNWTSAELDGNGIARDFATAAFKTLSYWNKATARGDLYNYMAAGGGVLDGQRIAVAEADVPNAAQYFADKGGVENWSGPLRGKGWGRLQGHWVRKDVLKFIENTNQEGTILQKLEALAREYKRTRTTLSLSYGFTNLLGNHGMLILNGGTGADLPDAVMMLMNKPPEFYELANRGAYEGTTMQEMIREKQRAGTNFASATESALSGIGKMLDKGTTAMAEELVKSLGGKPATADAIMDGLRDIAKTANPLVFNKFVDDLYRTALGIGILREGGTLDGAAIRMREDMYNVIRPRTEVGRFLTSVAFPWASWPIWAMRNVPRVAVQNWQTAAANILTLSAMAAVNEAAVFSGETDEERAARREAEKAAAYTKTNILFPERLYLSKDVSLRLGTANPFETYQQLGDVAQTFAETGNIAEATGLYQGLRKLPVRPSGPIPGLVNIAQGRNPLRPYQLLPETPGELAALSAEATLPGPTNLVRGAMNLQTAQEEADASGGEIPVGPTSQILRALGPIDIRNIDRDILNQQRAMKRIDFEINRQKTDARRRLDPNAADRISREKYRETIKRLETKRDVLKEVQRRRLKALRDYKSMQGQ